MSQNYVATFAKLIQTPFQHLGLVWGIVPLYFALLLSELTSAKKSFRTAMQTGFSFLWAGAQGVCLHPHNTAPPTGGGMPLKGIPPVHLVVTGIVLLLGVTALYRGLRRRHPRYASFLGHTRFSNYFMITLYPIQAHALEWTWKRLAAIFIWTGFGSGADSCSPSRVPPKRPASTGTSNSFACSLPATLRNLTLPFPANNWAGSSR
jgi:hypothetical protein